MKPDEIRISVVVDKKPRQIIINKKRTIGDLAAEVNKRFCNGKLEPGSFHLIFEGSSLDVTGPSHNSKTLEQLHIIHDSVLAICVRLGGGSLQELPGYISLTTTEPCCVSGDDNPQESRAKMPCGCVISVEMMVMYCETVIKDGNFRFFCSNCKEEWQYFLVRHVISAGVTKSKLKRIGGKLNKNFSLQSPEVQQCPFCCNYCIRDPDKKFRNKNRVVCPLCSARKAPEVEFCWCCLRSWKGGMESCGNKGCDGRDVRLRHLETCKTKKIGEVQNVPSIRSCGRCGNLIYHNRGCKHMSCRCGYNFCFVCLKPRSEETCQWQCGHSNTICPVAPRQTTIAEAQK